MCAEGCCWYASLKLYRTVFMYEVWYKWVLYHVVVTGYRSEWLFPGQGVKFSGKSTCPNNILVIKIGKNECVSKNKILVGRK